MRELVESYRFENFCSNLVLSSPEGALEGCDFVVADQNTVELLPSVPDLVLPSGETNKTLVQVEKLIGAFVTRRLGRSSTVLAFGGGVLCDLVGFAAASYMRGCGLILVPTTLLSMVDAGLGGKTGCNYQDYKNMIGAFYPAGEVRIVPEVLATLPEREFRSGLAELCKHSLLSGTDDLWWKLQEWKNGLRAPILAGEGAKVTAMQLCGLLLEGVRVKGQVVQRDLYERGERAFLNLGHTYAHALEKVSGFACTHGEAVAWGINQALQLSAGLKYCSDTYAAEVKGLLSDIGFTLDTYRLCPNLLSTESTAGDERLTGSLVDAMRLDKKRSASGIRLILQRGRAQTFIEEISPDVIVRFLQQHI
ncbi:3-dehydroquinate synthase [Candidatus Haliotispira prima]|uniref:3-dehydroquinate synthase n=1 Tax=Candidatus Haliotispira prima TaxID=3034016 RepID=A0ABY8MGU2_9SPIO|nr:3-dehydroquinate synthase [Candidatus Haliotispira prima]